ncbi:hypothetical protein NDU88_000657 [Pleurodeles waltl]|uniref:Uncharacterized protein n=1 Tax=Pleurodeles waltl TaxID=8319 RepID=A0AAV7NGQ9_PLEWA|nr:hypothetical protein NDU88_000657 [Pleurodeles waltl]
MRNPPGRKSWLLLRSSQHAMQTQIAAMAVDVNLLRTDLRVVAEHSVSTEKQVTCLQSEMDMLKASVATLELKRTNWKQGSKIRKCERTSGGDSLSRKMQQCFPSSACLLILPRTKKKHPAQQEPLQEVNRNQRVLRRSQAADRRNLLYSSHRYSFESITVDQLVAKL